MLISLSIRVELYLINVLYNYASIINMLPYFTNTVSTWQLCQCFDFMIVFTPICDNESVVFSFTNETTQMIHSSTKHSIYNSLLISRNKIKYMLNSTFKLHFQ